MTRDEYYDFTDSKGYLRSEADEYEDIIKGTLAFSFYFFKIAKTNLLNEIKIAFCMFLRDCVNAAEEA